MTSIFIRVAGVPVAKGRPRIGRAGNGRAMAFTPAKTRKYETYIRCLAGEAMSGRAILEGPVELVITAHLPVPKSFSKIRRQRALDGDIMPTKRPDLSNYVKSAEDALNGIVLRDDSQVVRSISEKVYSLAPAIDIEVMPLEGSSA